MNSNFRKGEDVYLLEGEQEQERQEQAATLKDEWMDNWLETEPVTVDMIWEAFNEQTINPAMANAYNMQEVAVLGFHAMAMISRHRRVLASIAYDERMT